MSLYSDNKAENVDNYLSKGSLAGVDGRIQSRNYENKEGRRVFVTEVVADNVQFMDSKGSNQQKQSITTARTSTSRQ